MDNLKRSLKMYLLCFKFWNTLIFTAIAALVILPHFFITEPATSNEFMFPIGLLIVGLSIFVFGLTKGTFDFLNMIDFLLSTKLAKSCYTLLSLVFFNLIGLLFIIATFIIKYVLSLKGIGSMDNFAESIFILLACLGAFSLVKIMYDFMRIIPIIKLSIISFIIGFTAHIAHLHFNLLILARYLFGTNKVLWILSGLLVWIAFNVFSYFYCLNLYESRIIRTTI